MAECSLSFLFVGTRAIVTQAGVKMPSSPAMAARSRSVPASAIRVPAHAPVVLQDFHGAHRELAAPIGTSSERANVR